MCIINNSNGTQIDDFNITYNTPFKTLDYVIILPVSIALLSIQVRNT